MNKNQVLFTETGNDRRQDMCFVLLCHFFIYDGVKKIKNFTFGHRNSEYLFRPTSDAIEQLFGYIHVEI